MTIKEIRELMKLIEQYKLEEFHMKDGEFEIAIRTDKHGGGKPSPGQVQAAVPQVMTVPAPAFVPTGPAPAASAAAAPPVASTTTPPPAPAAAKSDTVEIKSPMVGTFYRSPSPDKPAFVKIGDVVGVGDTVCMVEAMKLFNEIESEVTGKIVKVLIDDATPVEYDQVLFLVEPG